MVKKRVRDPEDLPDAPAFSAEENENESAGEGEGSDDNSEINVDFEWFNFLSLDFHGVKSLIRQLFDVDAQLLDLSGLADRIVGEGTVGSTVKVDGESSDPFAFLSVVNVSVSAGGSDGDGDGKEKGKEIEKEDCVKGLKDYLRGVAKEGGKIREVLENNQKGKDVGVVLAERLINVPAEVAPPMYRMLVDEMEAAVEDGDAFDFEYYVVVSKGYREVESALDREDAGPRNKKSKGKGKGKEGKSELFYFHPEDEVLKRFALASEEFEYRRDEGEGMADSKRAFQEMGIRAVGELFLIEKGKWEPCVEAMEAYLSPPA